MIKDILVIRLSKVFSNISPENFVIIEGRISEKLNDVYKVLVFMGENDTDKTTIEIIKY